MAKRGTTWLVALDGSALALRGARLAASLMHPTRDSVMLIGIFDDDRAACERNCSAGKRELIQLGLVDRIKIRVKLVERQPGWAIAGHICYGATYCPNARAHTPAAPHRAD